jgi:hypothetical protein
MAAFRVLEVLAMPGTGEGRITEDAHGCGNGLAFVFDGATSVADRRLLPGDSDAGWIARAGRDALLATQPGPLRERVRRSLEDVTARFDAERDGPVGPRHNVPSAALAVIDGREAGLFADCAVVVLRGDGRVEAVTAPKTTKGSERERAIAARALPPDALLARQKASRARMNAADGYNVFVPDPAAAERLAVTPLVLEAGDRALILSDGFYALVEEYGAYTDEALMAAALSKGLAALYAELRAIEAADPQCLRFPRFKTSDDATALLVEVAG